MFRFFAQDLFRCVVAVVFALSTLAQADTFYVTINGKDETARNGKTKSAAWKSLAYAAKQVQSGDEIRVGPGTFICTQTAGIPSGVAVAGAGRTGAKVTVLVATKSWKLPETPDPKNPAGEYLVSLDKVQDVTLADMVLASPPEHRITGAVYCTRSKEVTLRNLHVHDFRWAGLRLVLSSNLEVHHCRIENAGTEKFGFHGGGMYTRWIKHSKIHHNLFCSTIGGGYGYKGGGHEKVRIHHNYFEINGGFAIESAHENEYGVEIDHNVADRCFSIPKGGQGADPALRGCEYSFWVHHNLLTDSYTIEGPRNHLRLSHNFISIKKPNGRVYTHHGGTNHGPVWIHHNVVENVDRAFVWMNRGLAENIFVYNNTVYCADAGKRTGILLDSYRGDRLNNWVVKNNIFVAPSTCPRFLIQEKRGVPEKMTVRGNVCINMKNVPGGNYEVNPELKRKEEKPWPWYAPSGKESFVVDRGEDVKLPFEGKAPDIGAYEWGKAYHFPDVPDRNVAKGRMAE